MDDIHEDLPSLLTQYSELSKEYADLARPIKDKIRILEAELDELTAPLTFQMQTLEAFLKPLILATKESQKVPYLTAVYSKRAKWDTERLLAMAEEVPAILQAYEDGSTVQFRKTSH